MVFHFCPRSIIPVPLIVSTPWEEKPANGPIHLTSLRSPGVRVKHNPLYQITYHEGTSILHCVRASSRELERFSYLRSLVMDSPSKNVFEHVQFDEDLVKQFLCDVW